MLFPAYLSENNFFALKIAIWPITFMLCEFLNYFSVNSVWHCRKKSAWHHSDLGGIPVLPPTSCVKGCQSLSVIVYKTTCVTDVLCCASSIMPGVSRQPVNGTCSFYFYILHLACVLNRTFGNFVTL